MWPSRWSKMYSTRLQQNKKDSCPICRTKFFLAVPWPQLVPDEKYCDELKPFIPDFEKICMTCIGQTTLSKTLEQNREYNRLLGGSCGRPDATVRTMNPCVVFFATTNPGEHSRGKPSRLRLQKLRTQHGCCRHTLNQENWKRTSRL